MKIPGINVALCSNVLLALIWGAFATLHLEDFFSNGSLTSLLYAFAETYLLILFIARENAKLVSHSKLDWVFALSGTFLGLLLRPDGQPDHQLGTELVIAGILIQFCSYVSLNRSFGIVPAIRTIKTKGAYAIVRHPIYASYLFSFTGYSISNPTPWNLTIITLCIVFMILRIEREELILNKSNEYLAYIKKVRYKLIPFIY
jgi:Phospholipid methyltransferase